MRKLVWRLKKEKRELESANQTHELPNPDTDIIEDEDILETYKEEAEDMDIEITSGISNKVDDVAIKDLHHYTIELEKYIELWEQITEDSKAKALLQAIDTAYIELDNLWGKRKVLIFTESRRTQDYLFDYLSQHWFEDKVVCFNGDNNSPQSRAIYKDWKKEYEWTRYFSWSKSSDTRAALVEYFKHHAEILIATESASEWVNLQFCSLLVNYDLPWNPQRVEQRIWRCHRYGQEFDVLVMNLINTANRADERVFELLNSKLELFEGLFWASDSVLWALESGVDIEKKIFEIYQTCRTKEEIDTAFDAIQLEKQEEVQDKLSHTKEKIIDRFDEDVARRLKDKKQQSELMLNELQLALYTLVLLTLWNKAKEIDANTLHIQATEQAFPDGIYWFDTKKNNDYILRTNDALWLYMTTRAKWLNIEPHEIVFDLHTHTSRISSLEAYQWRSWWMQVQCLTINAYNDEQYLIHSCIDDTGEVIDEEIASKMFRIIWTQSHAIDVPEDVSMKLKARYIELLTWIKSQSRVQNEKHFDAEMDKLDHRAEDLKTSLEKQQKKLKSEIRQLKKDVKGSTPTLQEKIALQRKIKNKEKRLSQLRRELHQLEDQIEAKKDTLIDDIESRLDANCNVEELFTIRWHVV